MEAFVKFSCSDTVGTLLLCDINVVHYVTWGIVLLYSDMLIIVMDRTVVGWEYKVW
jgi:hypothetical protein